MVRKLMILIFLTVIFASVLFAEAQQPGKVPRIGYLADAGSSPPQAFLQGLRDLGYVEGKNIAFEYRTTEGKSERRADQIAELIYLKVDVIVTDATGAALAAKKATSAIPIVMTPVAILLGPDYSQPCSARWERDGVDISYRRVRWKTSRVT